MKCQKCNEPATFHITELTGGQPQELHLCEGCAKTYLTTSDGDAPAVAPTLANVLAKQLKLGQAADELAKLDKRACPVCGITFFEFRNQGRLGCPHDYVCFEKELTPLIANIHGETKHAGKRPRGQSAGTDEWIADNSRNLHGFVVAIARWRIRRLGIARSAITL